MADDGNRPLEEFSRAIDLRSILGPEFRRLLLLAHAEGLLSEVLRGAGLRGKVSLREGSNIPNSPKLQHDLKTEFQRQRSPHRRDE